MDKQYFRYLNCLTQGIVPADFFHKLCPFAKKIQNFSEFVK